MQGGILLLAGAASLIGAVFLVSAVELVFAVRRRREHEEGERHVKELRASYTERLNALVLEDEAKLDEADRAVAAASMTAEETAADKRRLSEHYEDKLDSVKERGDKALAAAKARVKTYEDEARSAADAYLADRQQEVEQELMDLVMAVTKKVLPAGVAYAAHKELVMQALRDLTIEAPR